MPKIITVAHQKGGVGKSTLVLNLAMCYHVGGLKTLVIDMDIQGSIIGLKSEISEFDIIISPEKLEEIPFMPYDIILIDTPPYLSNSLPFLFAISNFILIPTKTGFFDVMAIKATIALVKDAKLKIPSIISGIVLNMVKPRTALTEDVRKIIGSYEEGIMDTMIYERVAYIRSAITSGVLNSDDMKAKDEISSLAEEIIDTLSM